MLWMMADILDSYAEAQIYYELKLKYVGYQLPKLDIQFRQASDLFLNNLLFSNLFYMGDLFLKICFNISIVTSKNIFTWLASELYKFCSQFLPSVHFLALFLLSNIFGIYMQFFGGDGGVGVNFEKKLVWINDWGKWFFLSKFFLFFFKSFIQNQTLTPVTKTAQYIQINS